MGNTMRAALCPACTALIILLCLGCAGPTRYEKAQIPDNQMQQYLAGKPEDLKPTYRRILEEGERNRVLNLMRLGLDAMQMGHLEDAEWAFDGALNGIERVYANDEDAAKARSLWVEEGRKKFKGEPYERVMAYYYRGLLYIWAGDYQNARACYKGGMLQDAFAEEEQNRCDFALMLYLSGWCSQQIKDDILRTAAFEELKKLRPDIVLPQEEDNLLLVIETGKSPRKLSDGVGHYQLKFFRGRNFKEKKAEYRICDGPSGAAYPVEDIYWQAATRGGRQVDYILQGKANFRKQAAMVGSALSDVATATIVASTVFSGSSSELGAVGAGLGLIGVAAQVAAANARTEADTRYWENLPDAVHAASLKLKPGAYTIRVEFFDKDRVLLPELTKNVDVEIPASGSTMAWVRSREQFHSKPQTPKPQESTQ